MRATREAWLAASGALPFSFALAVINIVTPLLALASGHTAGVVAILVGCAGAVQVVARLGIGSVLRLVSDRAVVVAAGLLLSLSIVTLMASTALVSFAISAACQGLARACFWTGCHTHVVRGADNSVTALALINASAGVGGLVGPMVAGLLMDVSHTHALTVGAAVALAAAGAALPLARLPPFELRAKPVSSLWRQAFASRACWANATSGAWYGLLGSYVPIILSAYHSSAMIGLLISIGNGCVVLGAAASARVAPPALGSAIWILMVITGGTTVLVVWLAAFPLAAAGVIALSGAGAGAMQTLGPAAMVRLVHPEERGDAMAVSGTFRAGAIFAGPTGVAAVTSIAPLWVGMALTGVFMAAPALLPGEGRLHD